jgi:hypothetical protein
LQRLAVGLLDVDLARPGERGEPEHRRDAIFLEEERDAVRVGLHHLVLALHHLREVEVDFGQDDAVAGRLVLGLVEELAGIEQGLAGDAADVEAGAAERLVLALVDAGDFLAELGRPDRGDVPARPAADDDQIEPLRHGGDLRGVRRCCI